MFKQFPPAFSNMEDLPSNFPEQQFGLSEHLAEPHGHDQGSEWDGGTNPMFGPVSLTPPFIPTAGGQPDEIDRVMKAVPQRS